MTHACRPARAGRSRRYRRRPDGAAGTPCGGRDAPSSCHVSARIFPIDCGSREIQLEVLPLSHTPLRFRARVAGPFSLWSLPARTRCGRAHNHSRRSTFTRRLNSERAVPIGQAPPPSVDPCPGPGWPGQGSSPAFVPAALSDSLARLVSQTSAFQATSLDWRACPARAVERSPLSSKPKVRTTL
jgi:hypothetical protein